MNQDLKEKVKRWNERSQELDPKGKSSKRSKTSKTQTGGKCIKCSKNAQKNFQKCLLCDNIQHVWCSQVDSSMKYLYMRGRKPLACIDCTKDNDKIELSWRRN